MSTPVYNASEPNGGNPKEVNVNAQYAGLEFHYTYLAFCAFIVWLIIPGIGFVYGGLARRKSALALLFQSLMVASITTFQWMFWGYSLTYSRSAGPFIGDLANFAMKNVTAAPSVASPLIPEIVFCLYQMMFCACTVQIVIGGSFERGRIVPSLVFAFIWATIVYCPIASWDWNPNGWLFKLPSLDYAGGGPVHISSGWAALAYAFVLGKRKTIGAKPSKKAHNTTLVFLGTVFIWFGWFGFNGGSALNGTIRAMMAAFNTNTAASTGAIGWVLVDYVKHGRKFSVVGACEGVIAGLVGITPGMLESQGFIGAHIDEDARAAAGYVSVWAAALIGFLTAIGVSLCQNIGDWVGVDEGLDVFKLHGIGGILGSFLTGVFASSSVSMLDGFTPAPGAIDGNGMQIAKQLAEIAAISSYSFIVSSVILFTLKYIPGMHLRVTEEVELSGLDMDQFFDEQIGDRTIFEPTDGLIRGISTSISTPGTPPTIADGVKEGQANGA